MPARDALDAEREDEVEILLDPARPSWPGVLLVVGDDVVRIEAGNPLNFADSKAKAERLRDRMRPTPRSRAEAEAMVATVRTLAALAEKATPGPWIAEPDDGLEDYRVVRDTPEWRRTQGGIAETIVDRFGQDDNEHNDAEFVAACRDAVPTLCAALLAALTGDAAHKGEG